MLRILFKWIDNGKWDESAYSFNNRIIFYIRNAVVVLLLLAQKSMLFLKLHILIASILAWPKLWLCAFYVLLCQRENKTVAVGVCLCIVALVSTNYRLPLYAEFQIESSPHPIFQWPFSTDPPFSLSNSFRSDLPGSSVRGHRWLPSDRCATKYVNAFQYRWDLEKRKPKCSPYLNVVQPSAEQ